MPLEKVLDQFPGDNESRWMLAAGFAGVGVFSAWFLILSTLATIFPATTRSLFCPLLDGYRRGHAAWFGVLAVFALVIWCVAAFELAAKAGLVATPGG